MATHRYRSREITGEEIAFIRQLILDRPELSRWKLSRELCETWQWKQANGTLRDMVCRGLLLMLHRAGEIELPAVKRTVRNRIAERQKPEAVIPDNRPVRGPLANITPLEFVQVRRTPEESLFNSLVEQYHYLGYEQPIQPYSCRDAATLSTALCGIFRAFFGYGKISLSGRISIFIRPPPVQRLPRWWRRRTAPGAVPAATSHPGRLQGHRAAAELGLPFPRPWGLAAASRARGR
jgi:hypothetical protein